MTKQTSADKCSECNVNFYLNSSSDNCIAYPTGKYGCISYDNALKCTACDVDHFLASDVCTEVTTKVNNCAYYSADGKCSQCSGGYFLTNETTCDL